MIGFLIRLAMGAFGLWLAAELLPGMQIGGVGTLAAAAFLLGLVNAVVRPVVVVLTLPLTLLTLGLFLLVINAVMLAIVAALLREFTIDGFATALLGALIVSVTGWFASWNFGSGARREVIVIKRRR